MLGDRRSGVRALVAKLETDSTHEAGNSFYAWASYVYMRLLDEAGLLGSATELDVRVAAAHVGGLSDLLLAAAAGHQIAYQQAREEPAICPYRSSARKSP